MRGRKAGLLPLESAILETGIAFKAEGSPEFHGFRVNARLRKTSDAALFTTHGALYKALDRMERSGFLASRWEEAELALSEGRPRRRLYSVTATGEIALRSSLVGGARPGLHQVPQT